MLRALIADKLPDSARTRLQEAGLEVRADPALSDQALAEALASFDPDVLIVRSTKVTRAQLEAARSLQLVVRAGAGVNTIDLDFASSRGVYVSNCPGMNAVAVAELTFAHILNADRRVADNVADLRAGHWKKKVYSKLGRGLKGRTLGLIGVGNIACAVIQRALAFEMEVIAWSPSLTPERCRDLGVQWAPSALDVASQAEILSVHMALNPSTRGFVGRSIFERLPQGAIFVNTTRGPVVDEEALAWAVRERGLIAGLDVFCDEPGADGDWTHPLVGLDGVYGTHHIGASTEQAQDAVADEAVRVVVDWVREGSAPNCVNLAETTPATHLLVVRHRDEVGVLAEVLSTLREHHINVHGMENIVFSGAKAACARIQLDQAAPQAALDHLRAHPPIFDTTLVEL